MILGDYLRAILEYCRGVSYPQGNTMPIPIKFLESIFGVDAGIIWLFMGVPGGIAQGDLPGDSILLLRPSVPFPYITHTEVFEP